MITIAKCFILTGNFATPPIDSVRWMLGNLGKESRFFLRVQSTKLGTGIHVFLVKCTKALTLRQIEPGMEFLDSLRLIRPLIHGSQWR